MDFFTDVDKALDEEEGKIFYMHLCGFSPIEISDKFHMSRTGFTKKFSAIKDKLKRKVLKIAK